MKKAFVFPGQGSQLVNMGRDFYENFNVSKEVFQEVDSVMGRELSQIIFQGPQEVLTNTENAQPALMCVSIAILRALQKETGKKIEELCSFTAGHSLGEYSALCAAEALTLSDTTKLLKVRGKAFADASAVGAGSMAALVGANIEQAEDVVKKARLNDEVLDVANDNNEGLVVISGSDKSIENAIIVAQEMGIRKSMKVAVSGAFHTKLMEPAIEPLKEALAAVTISKPKVPVIANVLATAEMDPKEIENNLIKQIVGRVRWRESLIYLENQGVEKIVEIGSNKILTGTVGRTCKIAKGFALNSVETLKEYLKS